MRYPTVNELFFDIELKLNAYNFICYNKINIPKEYLRQLKYNINYDYVSRYYFMVDKDEFIAHLDNLIVGFQIIRDTEGFISTLASADSSYLEFSSLDSEIDEYCIEITTIINKLNLYRIEVARIKSLQNSSNQKELNRNKFKTSVFSGLANLCIDHLSVFEDNDNPTQLVENIKHFLNGDFESISPELNFIVREMRVGYFLITELKAYSDFDFTEIRNVKIKNKEYVEPNRASTLTKLKNSINRRALDSKTANEIEEIKRFLSTHKM